MKNQKKMKKKNFKEKNLKLWKTNSKKFKKMLFQGKLNKTKT